MQLYTVRIVFYRFREFDKYNILVLCILLLNFSANKAIEMTTFDMSYPYSSYHLAENCNASCYEKVRLLYIIIPIAAAITILLLLL